MSETAGRSLSARSLVFCWLAVVAGLVLVGRGLPELAGWKYVPLIPLRLLSVDWDRLSARGAEYTATLLVTVLLVGFNEELFARGVLLVGVRRLASERAACLWTSVAFGALHSGNALVGESPGTVVLQVLLATLISTLFYPARRATAPGW